MEIKEKKPLTIAEMDKIAKEREREVNTIKQEENKKFLGSLRNGAKHPVKNDNRFHLPVLHINDPTQWPSQPKENRLKFTDEVALHTCLGNCCGVEGLKAGCCHMDPDDMEHVLGPVDEDWIKNTARWLTNKGIPTSRSDLVIDFEEGKLIGEKFFTGERKAVFMAEESYPILRFQIKGPRFVCKFLNPNSGKCGIYEKRPAMCRGYLCQYVKANFRVRPDPKNHPNTFVVLR